MGRETSVASFIILGILPILLVVDVIVLVNLVVDAKRKMATHTVLLLMECVVVVLGTLCIPGYLLIVGGAIPPDPGCPVVLCLCRAALLGSAAVVTLMAGERWVAIGMPFFHERHVTAAKVTAVSIATLVTTTSLSASAVYSEADEIWQQANGSSSNGTSEGPGKCFIMPIRADEGVTGFHMTFVLSVSAILALNVFFNAACALVIRRLGLASHVSHSSLSHERAVMMLVRCLSIIFVASNLPLVILLLLVRAGMESSRGVLSIFIAAILISFVSEPFIHLILTSRYRHRMRRLIGRGFRSVGRCARTLRGGSRARRGFQWRHRELDKRRACA